MSLLLDALKRAEQEKQARQGEEAPRAEGPATRGPAPGRGANLELESVEPVAATVAPSARDREREREAARAVFAAKQPDALEPAPATGPSKLIVAVAGAALLVVAAGGAYVWYEMNRPMAPSARTPAVTAPRAPQPLLAAVIPPPATAPAGDAATPAAAAAPATSPGMKGAEGTPATRTRPSPAGSVVASVLQEAAGAPNTGTAVKLSPASEPPRVPADIRQGYDALRAGDLARARSHYEAALAVDPANVDGHLGLATVAASTGERAAATRLYRRTLELDASNASALAGLAALQDFTRPGGLEAKLRTDVAQHPQSPALHYTLGSLYASQARWTEAQAAFFEAYRLDPEDADTAYNLAVCLDHLGQARLAGDFYGRALAAGRNRSAQFDRGEVTRRIAELKP